MIDDVDLSSTLDDDQAAIQDEVSSLSQTQVNDAPDPLSVSDIDARTLDERQSTGPLEISVDQVAPAMSFPSIPDGISEPPGARKKDSAGIPAQPSVEPESKAAQASDIALSLSQGDDARSQQDASKPVPLQNPRDALHESLPPPDEDSHSKSDSAALSISEPSDSDLRKSLDAPLKSPVQAPRLEDARASAPVGSGPGRSTVPAVVEEEEEEEEEESHLFHFNAVHADSPKSNAVVPQLIEEEEEPRVDSHRPPTAPVELPKPSALPRDGIVQQAERQWDSGTEQRGAAVPLESPQPQAVVDPVIGDGEDGEVLGNIFAPIALPLEADDVFANVMNQISSGLTCSLDDELTPAPNPSLSEPDPARSIETTGLSGPIRNEEEDDVLHSFDGTYVDDFIDELDAKDEIRNDSGSADIEEDSTMSLKTIGIDDHGAPSSHKSAGSPASVVGPESRTSQINSGLKASQQMGATASDHNETSDGIETEKTTSLRGASNSQPAPVVPPPRVSFVIKEEEFAEEEELHEMPSDDGIETLKTVELEASIDTSVSPRKESFLRTFPVSGKGDLAPVLTSTMKTIQGLDDISAIEPVVKPAEVSQSFLGESMPVGGDGETQQLLVTVPAVIDEIHSSSELDAELKETEEDVIVVSSDDESFEASRTADLKTIPVKRPSSVEIPKPDSDIANFLKVESDVKRDGSGGLFSAEEQAKSDSDEFNSDPEDVLNSVMTISSESVHSDHLAPPNSSSDSTQSNPAAMTPGPTFRFGRFADPSGSAGPSLVVDDSELIGDYLAGAHGSGKMQYQILTDLQEQALCRVLPTALRAGQHEVYDAISKELGVPTSDPQAHRIMANITMFFANNPKIPGGSDSFVKMQAAMPEPEPELEPEVQLEEGSDSDSGSYF
jgi:hypothetical protein